MGLGRSASRSLRRSIAREAGRQHKRSSTYIRIQTQAASLPGSKHVETPFGGVWMSAIEVQLYEAMRQEGLDPEPQYYVRGYYADFAFPDVRILVEADGAVHDDPTHREHDRKRDWILSRQGWTVKRFHGTTIYHKAGNCAYVVRREVDDRRQQIAEQAAERERRRRERRDALLRPFRRLRALLHMGKS